MRGPRLPAAALRLLRFVVPACVVAASCVAILGLFRVVSSPAAQPTSQQVPSLHLGPGPGPTAAVPTPPASPSPFPSASPQPSPAPTRQPNQQPAVSVPLTVPVEVFNASDISGLAGQMAAVLRERGVNVASVANLGADRRPAAATAIYYPAGIRGQAQALARLTRVATISPAPDWLGSAGTLVLVLTDAPPAAVAAAQITLTSHVP